MNYDLDNDFRFPFLRLLSCYFVVILMQFLSFAEFSSTVVIVSCNLIVQEQCSINFLSLSDPNYLPVNDSIRHWPKFRLPSALASASAGFAEGFRAGT